MHSQENSTGKPLADAKWLEQHHNAKIHERTSFAKMLSHYSPKRVVDLGCASGLWLDTLDKVMPKDCEFIGVDCDPASLDVAKAKSINWQRKTSFLRLDIEKEVDKIPSADLTLAFNIFPYISDLDIFLHRLSLRIPKGILAIRQYDGASIRFGPMSTAERQKLETSLRVATESTQHFHLYDMDRTFHALYSSEYDHVNCWFELFERTSPFDESFIPYYRDMLLWTCDHISENSSRFLHNWLNEDQNYKMNRYFYEVDLVAIVS